MTLQTSGRLRLLGFAAAMALFSATLPAQSESLTLQDYVSDSISSHPKVLEHVYVFRQAEQDQTIAKSDWLPSLDLTATSSRSDGESPTVQGSQGIQKNDYDSQWAELALTQNLFNGFDTQNNTRKTQARMHAALYRLYDTADNIGLEAVKVYLNVVKHKRLLDLARNNVVSHEETLEKISRRGKSGVGRRSQLEQAEARLARANAGYAAQQNNLQDALTEAHQMLGRYVDPATLVEPSLPERPDLNLDALIDLALQQHPALRVAQENIEQAQYDRNRAKSRYYPKLDLRLSQEVGEDLNGIPGDTDETTIALTLTYNFFNGGADRAENRKRISAVHEQQQFAAGVRRQTINALRLAWAGDDSLGLQLKYLEQYVVQSRKTMVSYQEEFRIGQRDLIDLLDAKNELNSAENSYIQSYFDAVVARYRILEATGQLFQGLGLTPIVEENNLRIAKIKAHGKDKLPLDWDRDVDRERDNSDHCDNSLAGSAVNEYGCLGEKKASNNSKPVANADAFELNQNGIITIPQEALLANDVDADGDTLAIKAFTQPKNGMVERNDKGALVYRAAEGFVGSDFFSYIVSDSKDNARGMITLSVIENTEIDFDKVYYVRYVFARTDLTEFSGSMANKIILALKSYPKVSVSIDAYTDSVGSDAFNMELSRKRAKATKDALVKAGVAASRITVSGGGEGNPLADNSSKEGRAINRRGEFRFSRTAP